MQNWKTLIRPVYRQMRNIWLSGHARYCPLCESSFRRFLPKGEPARLDAMCPNCLSLERHRLLWLYLTREQRIESKTASLLHFAPEPGMRKKLQALPGLQYTACDIAIGRGDVTMDIVRLGFQSESFDRILCCHVLEHIPDDRAALQELHRVLKPGGVVILQVPIGGPVTDEDPLLIDPHERLQRFGQHDHVRFYGEDFERRVSDAGFKVNVIKYAQQLSAAEIERSRLTADGDYEDWIFVVQRLER